MSDNNEGRSVVTGAFCYIDGLVDGPGAGCHVIPRSCAGVFAFRVVMFYYS